MEDIVYFELNNWFCGRDYPDAEPFKSWLNQDLHQTLSSDEWAKENKLCIVACMVDMSLNYCITATKDWVLQNCPDLLSDKSSICKFILRCGSENHECADEYPYRQFLRFPDENGEVHGRSKFLEYSEENFGVHWVDYDFDEDDYDEDCESDE